MARFAIKIKSVASAPEVLPKKYKFYKQIIYYYYSQVRIASKTPLTTRPDLNPLNFT